MISLVPQALERRSAETSIPWVKAWERKGYEGRKKVGGKGGNMWTRSKRWKEFAGHNSQLKSDKIFRSLCAQKLPNEFGVGEETKNSGEQDPGHDIGASSAHPTLTAGGPGEVGEQRARGIGITRRLRCRWVYWHSRGTRVDLNPAPKSNT